MSRRRVYMAVVQLGTCRRCGKRRDLPMGACFKCSARVDGKRVPGGHDLWDRDNPSNRWRVRD